MPARQRSQSHPQRQKPFPTGKNSICPEGMLHVLVTGGGGLPVLKDREKFAALLSSYIDEAP